MIRIAVKVYIVPSSIYKTEKKTSLLLTWLGRGCPRNSVAMFWLHVYSCEEQPANRSISQNLFDIVDNIRKKAKGFMSRAYEFQMYLSFAEWI